MYIVSKYARMSIQMMNNNYIYGAYEITKSNETGKIQATNNVRGNCGTIARTSGAKCAVRIKKIARERFTPLDLTDFCRIKMRISLSIFMRGQL